MEAFLVSTGIVAVAEIGDKTQLLALVLAARYRAPLPIIAGIFIATIANHALAASVGLLVAELLGPDILRTALGISFLAMAVWVMIPDKVDEDETRTPNRYGPFLATLIVFFLVEIGDKTQIATIALAARFDALVAVTAGTTLGMMLANIPAVLIGKAAATKVPMGAAHGIAAAIFGVMGVMALLNIGNLFDAL